MNLKSILKFDNSKIIAPEYIILLSIDKKDEEITLTKYVFNNRDVLRFINYFKEKTDENDCVALKDRKRIKIPKPAIFKHLISIEELLFLLDTFKIKKCSNQIEKLNEVLKHKAFVRDSAGFNITDNLGAGIISNYINKNYKKSIKYTGDYETKSDFIFRLFNVGQANCSCFIRRDLLLENGKIIKKYKIEAFFDIGSTKFNKSLLSHFKRFNNGYIFISHFDNDHINYGRNFFNTKHDGIILFCPKFEIDKLSFAALAFLTSAIFSGCKIVQIELNQSNYINLGAIDVFQGVYRKNDFCTNSLANSKSLICVIRHKLKNVLIPGDALYYNFPTVFSPTHLIIPHHGCKYNASTKKLQNININKLEEAFVFCGPHLKYKHANYTHLKHFYKKGCTIKRFYKNKSNNQDSDIFDGDGYCKKELDKTIKLHKNYYDWHFKS